MMHHGSLQSNNGGGFVCAAHVSILFTTRPSVSEIDRNTIVFAPNRAFCWFFQPPSCSQ